MEDKIKYYLSNDEHISKLIETYKEKIEELLKKHNYVSEVTVVYKPAEITKDVDEFTGEEFDMESNECLEYDFSINPNYFPMELSSDLMDLSFDAIDNDSIELFPSDQIIAGLICESMKY